MTISREQLENWFTYHAPEGNVLGTEFSKKDAYETIRSAGFHLANIIANFTPPSADQTAAIRKVREAVMTANAAIACDGK